MRPLAVLFDLDGTLVQTREASWRIFERINRRFHLGVASQQDYFRLLEDNLFLGLRRLCRDEPHAKEVGRSFLAELEADYRPDFVPGVVDVIRTLTPHCALAVVSSNSTATIRRLLIDADVAHCFSHVFGGDVEADKRAVVRRFLADGSYLTSRDCSPAYREGERRGRASPSDLVLITDTTGDVKHARECDVRVVGVAWGMHREADLTAAGAEFVAIWPQEIVARLLAGADPRSSCGVPARAACGCQAPSGAACRCDEADVGDAGQIRRERRLTRSRTLEARLDPAPAATAPNHLILKSLARLRAAPSLP